MFSPSVMAGNEVVPNTEAVLTILSGCRRLVDEPFQRFVYSYESKIHCRVRGGQQQNAGIWKSHEILGKHRAKSSRFAGTRRSPEEPDFAAGKRKRFCLPRAEPREQLCVENFVFI